MIEVRGVTKSFGTMLALDDVSFGIGQGEILGFLWTQRRGQKHDDEDSSRPSWPRMPEP